MVWVECLRRCPLGSPAQLLNGQRLSWHTVAAYGASPTGEVVHCVLLPVFPAQGLGHFAVADAAKPSRVTPHLCSGQGPVLLWIHNPSRAVALGELRKVSRSGAGWGTLDKPSSPTPCLCKQTLVGPFSAPGTSLRNTGDWLQLFLGGPGGPPSQLQLYSVPSLPAEQASAGWRPSTCSA